MSQAQNENNNLEGKNNNDSNLIKNRVGNSDSNKESKSQSQSQDPRQLIRETFDKYLNESKKEEDEDKYNEALEKIKEMNEAGDYNLIIRKKAGKPSGLIILNKFKPGKYKKVQEVEKEEKEKEEKEKSIPQEKDREIIDTPMEEEEEQEQEQEQPKKKKPAPKSAYVKLSKPRNPRQAKTTASKTTKKIPNNNEDSLKSLNSEIKRIWERLDKYDKKYRMEKLKRTSKKAAKEMASLEGNKDSIIKNDEEMQLFDRLDKRFNPFSSSQSNPFEGSLKYLV